MTPILLLLLQADTLGYAIQHLPTPALPSPPIGGTQQQWIGYAVSVGVTMLVGIITRAIEKRKLRRRYKKESTSE